MRAVLHIHTSHSDGNKSVKEINELCLQNNIQVAAITDHDTVRAYNDIKELVTPVKFIIGVEMSVKYNGENIHVLGYFNDINENVLSFMKELSDGRITRAKKMVENLKKYFDIDITFEEVSSLAKGNIGRPHIAKVICDKLNISKDEVFKKYIGRTSPAFCEGKNVSLEEAITFLQDNGALISLAHPIQIKTFNYEDILDKGFDAIEAYHPDQDMDYTKKVIENATKYNLILTGGSDYHGTTHHNIFAERTLEGNDLDIFLDKLDNIKTKTKTLHR